MTERHVLALGLGVSALFVVAAAFAAVAVLISGGAWWTPIHLALAGAATVAIGAFMPHFAVTLAGTRPAPPVQRLAALGLLAVGALAVVGGFTVLAAGWAVAGAVAQICGLGTVAWHTISPSRDPLARRHHVVAVAYGGALLEFAVGIVLGGLVAANASAVLDRWALLKPAHSWVTLFGAVSLTIYATLVYLAPTIFGARIRASASLFVGVAGMMLGPPLVAIGFALDLRPLVLAAVLLSVAGALGQIGFVLDARRRRGRFTSEHDWRRVAIGHLLAGTGWFAVAVVVAGVELLLGRSLLGWSIGLLAIPMVAGWMLQELVGSWTHLAPSVTPGDAPAHARQRRALAVLSRSRLVAWNVGLGLLWLGLAVDLLPVAVPGGVLLAGSVMLSVLLLGRALALGRRTA